jgi:tetratricopeptide (TPR) repeat protein
MDDLEQRVDRMLDSQEEFDPALIHEILALPPDDPAAQRIRAKLLDAVGDQAPSPPLNIEDYYRPGEELYTLRWPLMPTTLAMLTMPFDALDRKTQFFVLFQEWTKRELDATLALNTGDLEAARAIFEECRERAEQLEVAELEVRSYQGLASVYDKAGDRDSARRALDAARSVPER